MHLELPKVRLQSLKEFSTHYLMIVLSILTALGLEAWIERVHHEHAAVDAMVKIEAEIHENLIQIKHQRDHDFARMHALEKIRDGLVVDLKAHASTAVINRHIHEADPYGLYLDWRWPVMRREAWDVSVANQSASWIDADRLRRYSSIYAAQNASAAITIQEASNVLSGQRMADILVDMKMDDYQPRELLHVVNQMAGAASEVAHGLDSLVTRMDSALSNVPESSTRMPASS
ncbi:hypothetical protein [Dyella tabacisoli]|uniref:Uncharacterized protein n=1 Tax=Dyella tabacisoli TaxID=2282381 RepID=A0A369UK42_9GAMM|nr:hypothetical protein [Dyella tabacisoli]RDD80485.1 hypothetical protein DVJ77_16475 [Dyella tabacisoli]